MRAFLRRRWFVVTLLLAVGTALAIPEPLAPITRPLPPHFVITVALFLTAWTMPTQRFRDELRAPWAALWAVLLSYTLVPAAGWALGTLSPLPDLRVGLLLAASVPCTFASCVLWTRLAGGNEATALSSVLASTLLGWLATTAWLTATTGAEVALEPRAMMLDLVVTLLLPTLAGQALRLPHASRRFADRHKALLGNLAQLFILAIVLKASTQVGIRLREGPARLTPAGIVLSGGFAMGLHVGALYAGLWSGSLLRFDRSRCIAVAFCASQKTLPVSLFLFETYFQTDFPLAILPLLFFHVGQLLLDTLIAERLKSPLVA